MLYRIDSWADSAKSKLITKILCFIGVPVAIILILMAVTVTASVGNRRGNVLYWVCFSDRLKVLLSGNSIRYAPDCPYFILKRKGV